jgi:hypothetical protein
VEGDGAENTASVRLSFADGGEIEDSVDNGVVLFLNPEPLLRPLMSQSSIGTAQYWLPTRSSPTLLPETRARRAANVLIRFRLLP